MDGTEMRERREIAPDELSAWLRAERAADDAEAERHLAALFTALAEPAPGTGFPARVLARIAAEETAARVAARRRRQLLLAAALVLVAGGMPVLLTVAGTGGLAAATALAARGLAAAGELGGQLFELWAALATALAPVARALARPWLLAGATALVLTSSLALVSLARWVEREKGVDYALIPY